MESLSATGRVGLSTGEIELLKGVEIKRRRDSVAPRENAVDAPPTMIEHEQLSIDHSAYPRTEVDHSRVERARSFDLSISSRDAITPQCEVHDFQSIQPDHNSMFSPRDTRSFGNPGEKRLLPTTEKESPVSQENKHALRQGDRDFLKELSFDVAAGDAAIPLEEDSLGSININS